MGKRTTLELRELILNHYKEGTSQRQIAMMVKIPKTTVQGIIARFVRENRVADKGRVAPNKIFDEMAERKIVRMSKKNPRKSAPMLAKEVEESTGKRSCAQTIRRVLNNGGMHCRMARRKPFVSDKNRKARVKFAKEHMTKGGGFWDQVIFCDESKFNIFGCDGDRRIYRENGRALDKENLFGTVKHGGGHVVVWGCMAASGVGRLVFVEGNMDKNQYLRILQENLKQSASHLGLRDHFRFYQDNDPKHKSGIVQTWLIWSCPHIIQTPAQSPDLNPIENLWDYLERQIRKRTITGLPSLKIAIQEEWEKIPMSYTRKLVDSMPKRIKMVIDQKGLPTKY